MSFEVGYGSISNEVDMAGFNEDETASYYLNAVVNLAKGIFLVPEIGVVDYKTDNANVDEGKTTYFGAKWQINF